MGYSIELQSRWDKYSTYSGRMTLTKGKLYVGVPLLGRNLVATSSMAKAKVFRIVDDQGHSKEMAITNFKPPEIRGELILVPSKLIRSLRNFKEVGGPHLEIISIEKDKSIILECQLSGERIHLVDNTNYETKSFKQDKS